MTPPKTQYHSSLSSLRQCSVSEMCSRANKSTYKSGIIQEKLEFKNLNKKEKVHKKHSYQPSPRALFSADEYISESLSLNTHNAMLWWSSADVSLTSDDGFDEI